MGLKTILNFFILLVASFDGRLTSRADVFDVCIHPGPVEEAIQNVVRFCMPLVMDLRMCGRDEILLLITRHNNARSNAISGWDGK